MAKRTKIPREIENAAFERDGGCVKCGEPNKIGLHHKTPVYMDGDNSLDNLVSLCWTCHEEWHAVGPHLDISFDEWKMLPAAWFFIETFLLPIDDGMSAEEYRSYLFHFWHNTKGERKRRESSD